MKIYNTATRQVEDFIPLEEGKVKLYTCGPTVYNYSHIGNMRTYVFEDVLRRTLKGLGYGVTHVMNITDVGHLQSDADTGEDKMTLAVAREKKSPWDIARFYEDKFFEHAQMLSIERPDIVCRATDHIPEMIAMVETLIRKGFVYESGGNVYFDVAEFPRYPEFARLNMTGRQATDRVDFDSLKRSQADFALWFSQSKFPNQVMKWDSPWGEGFPGWHIECSAMAMKYLGDRIDIHCGGIDHIPVHHTNEIAQSECCLDHDHAWVNYWMHGAFLTVDKEKMSKSKGDVLTVDKLAKDGFNPLSYRYLLMTTHYRGELRFNYDVLEAAESAYKTLFEKVQEWRAETPDENGLSPKAQEYRNAFWDAMRNDLHSPQALSVAWSVARADDIGNRDKLTLFREFDGVFALGLFTSQEHALSANEQALLDQREAARLRKDWQESDRLRDVLLNDHGVQIRDTKDGVEWVRTI